MMGRRKYSLTEIMGMRRDILIMDNIRSNIDGFYQTDRDRIWTTEMMLNTYLNQGIPAADLTAERKLWEKKRDNHYGIDDSEDAS